MKKYLLVAAGLVVITGALAYQNQTKLLLALVKYQSANEYEVGPSRDIPWKGLQPPQIISQVLRLSGKSKHVASTPQLKHGSSVGRLADDPFVATAATSRTFFFSLGSV